MNAAIRIQQQFGDCLATNPLYFIQELDKTGKNCFHLRAADFALSSFPAILC
jgi:hypothetical protein